MNLQYKNISLIEFVEKVILFILIFADAEGIREREGGVSQAELQIKRDFQQNFK